MIATLVRLNWIVLLLMAVGLTGFMVALRHPSPPATDAPSLRVAPAASAKTTRASWTIPGRNPFAGDGVHWAPATPAPPVAETQDPTVDVTVRGVLRFGSRTVAFSEELQPGWSPARSTSPDAVAIEQDGRTFTVPVADSRTNRLNAVRDDVRIPPAGLKDGPE
jgi:hypothetical protein